MSGRRPKYSIVVLGCWLMSWMSCGGDQPGVLVSLTKIPSRTAALQATFSLNQHPAAHPESWQAPASGFRPNESFFVRLSPNEMSGSLTIELTIFEKMGVCLGTLAQTVSIEDAVQRGIQFAFD